MIKRGLIGVFLVVLFMICSFVSAYAPVDKKVDDKDSLTKFWNNFVDIDHGVVRLDKSLPVEISNSLVLWGSDGFAKRIDFTNYVVKDKLAISVVDGNSLQSAGYQFLNKYAALLGIDTSQLQLAGTYSTNEFFSSTSSSPSPSPSPSPSSTASPSPSPISNTNPAQTTANLVFRQKISGYNVGGSFVLLVFKKGTDGKIRLVSYKSNFYKNFGTTTLTLTEEYAVNYAKMRLSGIDQNYLSLKKGNVQIVNYPVRGNKNSYIVIPAYKITFEESQFNDIEKIVAIVDNSGNVLNSYDSLIRDTISGRVSGSIYSEAPAKGQKNDVSFKNERILAEGTTGSISGASDKDGKYTLNINGLSRLRSSPSGQWATSIDRNTGGMNWIDRYIPISDYNFDWTASDVSYKQEMSNAFYHTNIVHDFAVSPNINALDMNFEMPVYVNTQQSCNAFYDPWSKTLNFFKYGTYSGTLCEATSLFSDVVYHEYSHGITDSLITLDDEAFPYWDETGNLNEGVSDYAATSISNSLGNLDPACMDSLFVGEEGQCFRRADGGEKYPNDYFSEPHSGMLIITGALWDLQQKMISKYGKDEGIRKADGLAFGALRFQPTSFADYLDDIIMADDGNGNVLDGTTNIKEICDSFAEHGIQSGYCAGMGDLPMAIIYSPKPRNNRFFGDEKLDIIGAAWPAKDGNDFERRLWLYDFADSKMISEEIKSDPVKKGILGTIDFSQLIAGHKYSLVLYATDKTISYTASANIDFIKSHEVNVKWINDKNTVTSDNSLAITSLNSLRGSLYDVECGKLTECEQTIDVIGNSADIFVLARLWESGEYTHQFYFKPYNFPMSAVNFKNSELTAVSSNIQSIIAENNYESTIERVDFISQFNNKNKPFYGYISWSLGGSLRIHKMSAYSDSHLQFGNYFVYRAWSLKNIGQKKLTNLGYILQYPFTSGIIDESAIKSVKINLFSPFVQQSYLDSFSSIVGTVSAGSITNTYSYSRDDNKNFLAGEYIFQFLPAIGDFKIDNIVNGFTSDFIFRRSFYNGFGKDVDDAPDSLTNDISVFKDPFSLKLETVKTHYFTNPARYVLRGYISDSFTEARGLIGHYSSVFGNLQITLPSGKIETISPSAGDYLGSWIVDCDQSTQSHTLAWPPILRDKSKFCQVGTYNVDWVMGDSDGDGVGDVFADKRILELHKSYYFDGQTFTILSDPVCGDNICSGRENCRACGTDCGVCRGATTGWVNPTQCSGAWGTCANGYSNDDINAVATPASATDLKSGIWQGYDINIPANSYIKNVKVELDGSITGPPNANPLDNYWGCYDLRVSTDGSKTWKDAANICTGGRKPWVFDITKVIDWTPEKLNSVNLRVKLDCEYHRNPTCKLDWLPVVVNYETGNTGSQDPPGVLPRKFIRGDVDGNGAIDINDPLSILAFMFQNGKVSCMDSADVDDSGVIDINDATYLLNWMFLGGKAVPEPKSLGVDSTQDNLGCACYGPGC